MGLKNAIFRFFLSAITVVSFESIFWRWYYFNDFLHLLFLLIKIPNEKLIQLYSQFQNISIVVKIRPRTIFQLSRKILLKKSWAQKKWIHNWWKMPKSFQAVKKTVIKIGLVHFSKFFLWYLLIKIPNEKLILHNDCCKPKKSWGEKCHFQGTV